jgi:hypothetical protein
VSPTLNWALLKIGVLVTLNHERILEPTTKGAAHCLNVGELNSLLIHSECLESKLLASKCIACPKVHREITLHLTDLAAFELNLSK